MSAAGTAHRLSVFGVFAALAAAGFLALVGGSPATGVPTSELAALERELLDGARLHQKAKPTAPPGSASFCAECHPPPAHDGRRVADAMANEHAARMDCLVCHWSTAAGARPAPSWQVLSGSSFLAALPPERSSREHLAALRTAVTGGRRCFERSPGCVDCHRPGGMAALLRPGANAAKGASLERLASYFTLAPDEKWYFPQLH